MKRLGLIALVAVGAAGNACGGTTAAAPPSFEPLRAPLDATLLREPISPARLVPESVALEHTYGIEPGGGVRGIAGGVRVVSYASGAVVTASERLAQLPSAIVVLPERLGGGVVLAIGDTLWRAERWLAPAVPLVRTQGNIRGVSAGLDRVYLRLSTGALAAVHPVTGQPLDSGSLPPSPSVTAFAALDGFRAVALADLRGVVATTDAGATWRTLTLPVEPRTLAVEGDVVTVLSGREAFEVRPEGDVVRVEPRTLSAQKRDVRDPRASTSTSEKSAPASDDIATKIFGARPLAAALTDGVALEGGTSLVARDGALAKIRLIDGAVIDLARDAFPLRQARCRGIVVGDGPGFVCGEPRGRTQIYRWVARTRRLETVLAFDGPRVVLAGGSGAIAIRGRCAEDGAAPSAVPGAPVAEISYCIRDASGQLREQVLTAHVENARVVPLRDGTLAVIGAPRGDLGNGHLTLASRIGAKQTPIVFDAPADVARRVLAQGMWLEGFEERAPGVLAGWVEHAGTMLGVELRLDGHAKHGAFVRDAGTVIASGRYGIGFTTAQRGYETTDYGMTWKPVELPDPVAQKYAPSARGCSAAGCVIEGWVRVGWGESTTAPASPKHLITAPRSVATPTLDLSCDIVARSRVPAVTRSSPPTPVGSVLLAVPARLGSEFTPFFSAPPPALHAEEVGTTFEVQELVDHSRPGLVARSYVWGAKGIEWDATSKWIVRYISPFASSGEVYSTAPAKPPRAIIEAARFAASAGTMRALSSMTFAASDDPRHAMMVLSRNAMPPQTTSSESFVILLDDARAPVEVRRADGETFGRIDSALRHEGRWFVLSEPDVGEATSTVLWEIEAGVAREVLRVPRVAGDIATSGRGGPARLARRRGEGMIGIVVDGQPASDRIAPLRWVLGVDPASGRVAEMELLGPNDFGGQTLAPCIGDEGGWAFDAAIPTQPIRAVSPTGKTGSFKAGYGRVVATPTRSCIDRLAAIYDGSAEDFVQGGARAASNKPLEVGLLTGVARQSLRCSIK